MIYWKHKTFVESRVHGRCFTSNPAACSRGHSPYDDRPGRPLSEWRPRPGQGARVCPRQIHLVRPFGSSVTWTGRTTFCYFL